MVYAGTLVKGARDEAELVAWLDAWLERGAAAEMARLGYALRDLPTEEILDALDAVRRTRLNDLPHETRGLVLEALGIQEQLQPICAKILGEVTDADLQATLVERMQAPLGYLAEFPAVVAEMMLAAERGMLGAMAAIRFVEHPSDPHEPWQLLVAARLWRDGMRSMARLTALVRPALVSFGLVPSVERLDLGELALARAAESAWIAERIATHPDQDRVPLYDEPA